MPDQQANDRAESALNAGCLDTLEHLGEQVHESGVDQPVAHIRVDDDALKVEESIEFLVYS